KQYTSLDLTFEEGLVGIIGRNGAGKSTIFEAILYCLFGKETQLGTKNFARSTYAADETAPVELKLSFLIGQMEYEVQRSFRGRTLTAYADLYRNGQQIATGVSVVNQELVRILGLDAEAFRRSVFSGQKELAELSNTNGEERKKLVRRMMGFDTLDTAQQMLRSDINALKNQIEGQSSTLLSDAEVTQLTEELTQQKSLSETRRTAAEEAARQLQSLKTEGDVISAEFQRQKTLYDQFNNFEKQKSGQEARKKELTISLEALRTHRSQLEQRKIALDVKKPEFEQFLAERQRLTVMEQENERFTNSNMILQKMETARKNISNAEVRIAEMKEAITAADAVSAGLKQVAALIAELETQLRVCSESILPLQKEVAGTEGLIRDRKERLKSLTALGVGGQCPTCLQPLLDNYARAVSELERELDQLQEGEQQIRKKRIEELAAEQKTLTEAISKKRQEETALNQDIARLRETWRQMRQEEENVVKQNNILMAEQEILSKIGEVHYDRAAHEALRAWVSAHEKESVNYQSEERYLTSEFPKTDTQISQTAENIRLAEEHISRLTQETAGLQFDQGRYQLASKAFDEFRGRFADLSERTAALGKEAVEAQAAADNTLGRLENNERIRQKIADRMVELDLLRRLDKHLTEFRTEILEKVSPAISRVAGELFNRITRGKYEGIEVSDSFEFSISDNGKMYPITRFSGGEIDLANFCLRIAITRAIIELSGAGHRLEFLAFDEIFGSQDEDRRMEIMNALALLREQFPQIYIISHIESLRDYFPHLLEVQSSATGSTAVWR
ncbi:MAG: AAA family ATPase, partial [Bacteroidota bacterium]